MPDVSSRIRELIWQDTLKQWRCSVCNWRLPEDKAQGSHTFTPAQVAVLLFEAHECATNTDPVEQSNAA